jgi:hypothetical protein
MVMARFGQIPHQNRRAIELSAQGWSGFVVLVGNLKGLPERKSKVEVYRTCGIALSRPEAIPVFTGNDEGFDHLSFLDPDQNVVTSLGELIQLGQPEVVA